MGVATVTATVDSDVRDEAEGIMRARGVTVSSVIDALYRQIIASRRVPFPVAAGARPRGAAELSDSEIRAKLLRARKQADAGECRPYEQVFDELERGIG